MATVDDYLAQLAADRGHGDYALGRPYRPDEVAISIDDTLADPDRTLTLRSYPFTVEPDSRNPWTEARWQWRFRGPRTGDRTDSATRAAAFIGDVHGLGPITLPSGLLVMSVFCLQSRPIALGRDEAGRPEHMVDTRIEYLDPTAHRPA